VFIFVVSAAISITAELAVPFTLSWWPWNVCKASWLARASALPAHVMPLRLPAHGSAAAWLRAVVHGLLVTAT
jgi:hypothetical protein